MHVILGFGEKWLLMSVVLCILAQYYSVTVVLAVLVIAVVLSLREQKIKMEFWKRRGVPGPEPNFFTGNSLAVYRFGQKKVAYDNRMKFGNFYGEYLMGRPFLIVSDLSLMRQMLVKDFKSFINRPWLHRLQGNSNLMNHVLFTMRDQRWKDVRNVLTPNFTTGRLKRIFPILSDCSSIAVDIIEKKLDNGSAEFPTRKILGNLIMDMIAKSAFGVDGDFQHHDDRLFVKMVEKIFAFPLVNPYRLFVVLFPNVTKLISVLFNYEIVNNDGNKYFTRLVRQTITERIKNPEYKRDDFLQMIIETSAFGDHMCGADSFEPIEKEFVVGANKKAKLSEIEVIAQSFLFIAAGYETTTTTLQCALYSLAVNPEIQEKVYEEVIRVVGDKEHIQYEDLNQLEYVAQVVMETLRLYPPVGSFRRECSEQTVLNNVTIEKGQAISVPVFAIHRNEQYYSEPDRFDPDRFSPTAMKNRDPLAFCPFGYGPRQCIGTRLALQNARMVIASLIRRLKFSSDEHSEGATLEIHTFGTTRPVKPLVLRVERRCA